MPRPVQDISTYWERTQWPLQALYFLLPILVAYQVGTVVFATPDHYRLSPILAESKLDLLYSYFGVTGSYLASLTVVGALLGAHLVRRDPWKPEPRLYGFMLLEAVALAVPLFMFMRVLFLQPGAVVSHGGSLSLGHGLGYMAAAVSNGSGGMIPSLQAGVVFSLGAGIYEELVFRLIAIAALHALFDEVLALPKRWSAALAVLLSAVAFSLYHFYSQPFEVGKFLFYAFAGVYFAGVYLLRGFGIVAVTHAAFDVMFVVLAFSARG